MAAASEPGAALADVIFVASTSRQGMCQAYVSFCCLTQGLRQSAASTAMIMHCRVATYHTA